MRKPNLLLGLTGSVATILAPKIVKKLQEIGDVKVVMTQPSQKFYNPLDLYQNSHVDVFTEEHEWNFDKGNSLESKIQNFRYNSANCWSNKTGCVYTKDDPVLHIELRKWADILVIAPLSANTLAKMANGICDNLLTSVVRAWDITKPIVVAPAMNTEMWLNPFSEKHIDILKEIYDFSVVAPQEKKLACGDSGVGAMAHIDNIVNQVIDVNKWYSPLGTTTLKFAIKNHPGCFGFNRKYDRHTGVDLYVHDPTLGKKYSSVFAVEGGTVVSICHFTGPQIDMPWWNDTEAVFIEGRSGVVAYCEVDSPPMLKVGNKVKRGQFISQIKPVLPKEKQRNDIPGHSNTMLHLELYPSGYRNWHKCDNGEELVQLDPTPYLLQISNKKILDEMV